MMDFEKNLKVETTNIPGLLLIDLSVHGDNRGWFKENYQQSKLRDLGLPDLNIVQNNISFNEMKGATRGIHAEPWNKYISLATGKIFGAWVDLREGETFGEVFTCELDPSKAIYVPRGVGNSFQALEDGTAYTYLVDAHWSESAKSLYTFVNLADPDLGIKWPIDLDNAQISEADKTHPLLKDISSMKPKKILVIGSKGQLGKALQKLHADSGIERNVDYMDLGLFDISDPDSYESVNWQDYDTVINACAYTAVDAAETEEGRLKAWKANAQGPALLAKCALENDLTVVHVSSDYVFDGTNEIHLEDEPFSPLSVYGQSKAAGDLAISILPKHYIVRTSWVIGDGKNFVKTMMSLSDKCADPSSELCKVDVVDDQIGRLAFTDDLARFIMHLLCSNEPYGTYNFSNPGKAASWNEIASLVFELRNGNPECVNAVSTEDYYSNSETPIAPRPKLSALALNEDLLEAISVPDWKSALKEYVTQVS